MKSRTPHEMADASTPRAAQPGGRRSRPWLDRWMAILHRIGNVQAWVLLTLIYVVLFLPMGLVFRLFNDPLRIRRKPGSNWQPFTRQYDHIEHAGEQA